MDEDDLEFKSILEQFSEHDDILQAAAAAAAASHSLSKTSSFVFNPLSSSASMGPATGPSMYGGHHPNLENIKREASLSIGSNSGFTMEPRKNSSGGNSTTGSEIGTRLRAASDMFQKGIISHEQKSVMKSLVLTRDPTFNEEFEKVQKTRDPAPLRALLNARQREMLISTGSIDNVNFGDISLGKDRSGSTSSIGQIFDFGLSRKRNASTSTPIIRSHKTIAAASGVEQIRVPTMDTNFGPAVTSSKGPAFQRNGGASSSSLSTTVSSSSSKKSQKKEIMQNDSPDDEEEETLDENSAKFKKNERERRRRAALSNGFDALSKLLKIPPDAKLDKTAILQHAVVRITQLQQQVERLEGEREGLVAALQQRPYQSSNNF